MIIRNIKWRNISLVIGAAVLACQHAHALTYEYSAPYYDPNTIRDDLFPETNPYKTDLGSYTSAMAITISLELGGKLPTNSWVYFSFDGTTTLNPQGIIGFTASDGRFAYSMGEMDFVRLSLRTNANGEINQSSLEVHTSRSLSTASATGTIKNYFKSYFDESTERLNFHWTMTHWNVPEDPNWYWLLNDTSYQIDFARAYGTGVWTLDGKVVSAGYVPPIVPVPASLPLGLSALAALGAVAARRQRHDRSGDPLVRQSATE